MTQYIYIYGKGLQNINEIEKAVQQYKRAAKKEQVSSQYAMGVFYQNGYGGLKKDIHEAMYWYRRAMEKGHKKAEKYYYELKDELAQQQKQPQQKKPNPCDHLYIGKSFHKTFSSYGIPLDYTLQVVGFSRSTEKASIKVIDGKPNDIGLIQEAHCSYIPK